MRNKQLSPNFYLSELVKSNTAVRLNIDNTPTTEITKNLTESTVNLFQLVRDLLGQPMIISSGYRCAELNKRVGGAQKKDKKTGKMVPTSAHCYGYAIDFTAPAYGSPLKIARFLAKTLVAKGIKFDQIIMEFGDWVHISWKSPSGAQRGQILTAKKVNGKTDYVVGV